MNQGADTAMNSLDTSLEKTATTGTTDESRTENILFVDDEAHILSSIRRLIRPLRVNAHFANSAAEGLEIMAEEHIDLVVSDMRMPEMDGAAFLSEVSKRWPDTITMLLTGYADISSTIKALNDGGIYRYISKPWDDEELKKIISDGLRLKRLEREKSELIELTRKQNDELQDLNKNLEKKVEERTEEIRQTSAMLDLAYAELKTSYTGFMRVFSGFINNRQALRRAESNKVADLSLEIANILKLKEEHAQAVYHAALLHQIGKAGFSDQLLNLPEEALKDADRLLFEQYPLLGETTLSTISGFEKTAVLIRNHMEAYDGTGFPDKLGGNNIRSGARIIRVARDFIGLQTGLLRSSHLTNEEAFSAIKSKAEKLYDPVVVKALSLCHKKYDLTAQYADEHPVDSYCLKPGMVLARNIVNSNGMLLIAEGNVLTTSVIEKILNLEKLEETCYQIYVQKTTDL